MASLQSNNTGNKQSALIANKPVISQSDKTLGTIRSYNEKINIVISIKVIVSIIAPLINNTMHDRLQYCKLLV